MAEPTLKNSTLLITIALLLLFVNDASAVPSFARQANMECRACHTVFPELTPLGRSFKLSGYSMTRSDKPYEFPPPLAGMAQTSYTNTDRSQPKEVFEDNWTTRVTSRGNNIVSIPQQLSVFYGGRLAYNLGAFVQATYDGNADRSFLDNTDIRYTNSTTVGGRKLIYGITINNNPTVQDVWNSTPAWGFPSATSGIAPTPAAASIIDGTLAQQVGGIGLYGYWNNLIYAEVSIYRTARNGITRPLGAGTHTDMVLDDAAPYWRLVLRHDWAKQNSLSIGTYGMVANIYPGGNSSGPSDRFADIAFDAQYQYIDKDYFFSAQSTWIHENQDWNASFDLGNTAHKSDDLNTFRVNANYYYRSHFGDIGGTVGYFSTTGDKDSVLYSPNQIDGSRTGKPNSDGFILEAVYLPWKTGKISLQYTIYNRFNGAYSDYDGYGRNASDNNTLFLLVWLMF
jgi:hypothetical protein